MKKILNLGWPLNFFFAGALVIPLESPVGWTLLSYKKIPSHEVQYTDHGLNVHVKKSAAPLIYKLGSVQKVNEIEVKGRSVGKLNIVTSDGGESKKKKTEKIQGDKGKDDFILRIGLVIKGDKKLNFIQRKLAPKWVLQLHQLAPKGEGIDRIEFFNVVSDKNLLGRSREHPLSSLLFENFVWFSASEGNFSYSTRLKVPLEVVAIWISIDGDDSGSDYQVQLTSLQLK